MLDQYHAGCIGAALTFTLLTGAIAYWLGRDKDSNLLAGTFFVLVAAASAGACLTMGLSR